MAYVATGRVASDPDFHELPDGSAICMFRLAATRRDRCGNPQTEWFTVRATEDAAVMARDLARKGAQIEVSGTLRAAPRESGTAGSAGMLIDSATVTAAHD